MQHERSAIPPAAIGKGEDWPASLEGLYVLGGWQVSESAAAAVRYLSDSTTVSNLISRACRS
jgi:hypothetical protein